MVSEGVCPELWDHSGFLLIKKGSSELCDLNFRRHLLQWEVEESYSGSQMC